MKLLLDECIDRRLAKDIEGHEVVTVPQAGWAGVQNGDLLRDLRTLLPTLHRILPTASKGQVTLVSA